MGKSSKPSAVAKPDVENKNIAALTLGALGVVFGDIGTNPLYAIRQCFTDCHNHTVDPAAVLGILSLIFWSLILVVCVKYLTFIIRADHEGEGGTFALLALIQTKQPPNKTLPPKALVLMVLIGSALLYGDGVITPAISVLSAVEGLKVAAPGAQPFVVPVSLGILIGLFLLQSRGTGVVGSLFGPVMLLWFLAVAALGIHGILQAPQILKALNPVTGLAFLFQHSGAGFTVLGAVVLCFSGAEALFADLGHFGPIPIELAWYALVLPALVLNYFGQGALALLHPDQTDNPFYALVPHFFLWPTVILATLATVIASQALISGAFTLTEQAIHMGYFPRFDVVHTSKNKRGQIYIAAVNYGLMFACAAIVLGFRSSEKLGSAYGLAVIGTMTVTSLTYFVVLRKVWKWPLAGALLLVSAFLVIDLAFLAGNLVKIFSGAWVPLLLGIIVFGIFWIWTVGQARYHRALSAWSMPLKDFLREVKDWPERRPGTGIFLTLHSESVPLIGRNHWLREQARHEQVLLISILEAHVPYLPEQEMQEVEELGSGVWRIKATFGFMQHPDISLIVKNQPEKKLKLDWDKLVCYLPEPNFVPKGSWWRQWVGQAYKFLLDNSLNTAGYFRVPPQEIIHVGVRLEI